MPGIPKLAERVIRAEREIRRLRVRMDQISAGGKVRATSIVGVIPSGNRPVEWYFNANLLGLGDELELLEGLGVWISGSFAAGRAYYEIGAYCAPPCDGAGVSGSRIEDADADTYVDVEQNPDEDKVRFGTGGVERAVLDATAFALAVDLEVNKIQSVAIADQVVIPLRSSAVDRGWRFVAEETGDGEGNVAGYAVEWQFAPDNVTLHPDAGAQQFVVSAHVMHRDVDSSGTITGATANTLTKAAAWDAKLADMNITGHRRWAVLMTSGAAAGEYRAVIGGAGTTTITVDEDWGAVPSSGDSYEIHSLHRHLKLYAKDDSPTWNANFEALSVEYGLPAADQGLWLTEGFYMADGANKRRGSRDAIGSTGATLARMFDMLSEDPAFTDARISFFRRAKNQADEAWATANIKVFPGDGTATPTLTINAVTGEVASVGGVTVGDATPGDNFLLLKFNTSRPWQFETDGADGATQGLVLRSINDGKRFKIQSPTGTNVFEVMPIDAGGRIGFYGAEPVVQPAAYTITNRTPRRTLDCDLVTLDQLADFVATMCHDRQQDGLAQ